MIPDNVKTSRHNLHNKRFLPGIYAQDEMGVSAIVGDSNKGSGGVETITALKQE